MLSHVPVLCEDNEVPYVFVPSKEVSQRRTGLDCRDYGEKKSTFISCVRFTHNPFFFFLFFFFSFSRSWALQVWRSVQLAAFSCFQNHGRRAKTLTRMRLRNTWNLTEKSIRKQKPSRRYSRINTNYLKKSYRKPLVINLFNNARHMIRLKNNHIYIYSN